MKAIVPPRWPLAILLLGLCPLLLTAAEPKAISLPQPKANGGKPLMEALSLRRTGREFKGDALDDQTLANLLWAGFGINRPATGQRTAPSAMNAQEIDIYVALPQGLFLYEPKAHRLEPVLSDDLRARAGGQDTFRVAPVTLIFVADLPRLAKAKPETRPFYAAFDAGCISQNIYLFCAAEGLATVVHDLDRAPLAEAMKLKPDQQIILAQAVGYPKDEPAETQKSKP
jgi:nitroreductase